MGLAGVAAVGLAMIWLVMPETRRSANRADSVGVIS
jgi:hypothetical protein